MKEFIFRCFPSLNKGNKYNSLSGFFQNSSDKEKEELFSRVIEKANKDQRDIIDRYNRKCPISK
ncbi:MAG TPA: hypothetical protein P5089_03350 [Candidatus Portnoybacteria bacterium]|nr:hypothetical protein [Candidatus Portnoybacteria bacterium]